jgi:hypothetical protein
MKADLSPRFTRLAAPLALMALAMAALWLAYPPFSQLDCGDWAISAYPMFRFNMDTFRMEGVLPLWNPFILGGMTHLTSFNVWALYPTELLALLFSPEPHTFYWLDTLLHLMLAGAGFYWWMRLRGMGRAAAFTSALCFMLGGRLFTLAGAGHMSWVRSYGLFPWTFGLLELGFRDGRMRWALFAGAVQSLSVIATGLQFTTQIMLVAAGWLALRGRAGLGRRTGQFAVFGSAMALLSAGVWLPGLEHFRQSLRADQSAMSSIAGLFNLGAYDLPSLVLPDIYGQWPEYWGPQMLGVASEYFGLVPMALAVLGIIVLGRSGWRWLLLAGAGLVLAMGPATPVGAVLSSLPVFSGFRAGLRWLFLPYIAGAVFAGFGLDFLLARRKNGGRVAAFFAAFACACLILYAVGTQVGGAMLAEPFVKKHVMNDRLNPMMVMPGVDKSLARGAVAGALASGAFALAAIPAVPPLALAGVLWGHSFFDLVRAGSAYFVHSNYGYRGPDEVVRQINGAEAGSGQPFRVATDEYTPIANMRMREGIQSVSGYHSLPLAGYYGLYSAALAPGGERLRPLLGVKYLVQSNPRPAPGRVIGSLPRVFPARESVACSGLAGALAVTARRGWTPATVPVEGPGAETRKWDSRAAISLKWGRDAMEAEVLSGGPALAVFLETWYPAWKALVDGRRVSILRAYGALRAVPVPAGRHRIRMVYDSWTLKAGLWCSITAWIALILSLVVIRRRLN